MEDLFVSVVGTNPVVQGFAGGVVIAFLNLVGALAIFVMRNPSRGMLDGALGFSAGVMLAASFTSLILPGIEAGGLVPVMIGVLLGTVFLDRSDHWVPHAHLLVTGRFRRDQNPESTAMVEGSVLHQRYSALILFILAITLHNMPEGLSVGVAFGAGEVSSAISLMLAIGIQNIPEGLAVSITARNAGLGSHFYAAFAGIRAGLVEIPLAVFGAVAVTIAEPLLPYAMGFAAGAMLYVISDEIIPETHAKGYERIATFGTIIGIIVMLSLDVSLG
ncbi:MAG: ZIP family metal transporter [Chloroflexota bacterium]|nr:ZIP family metal transporter [Chloroflexota bacterium]